VGRCAGEPAALNRGSFDRAVLKEDAGAAAAVGLWGLNARAPVPLRERRGSGGRWVWRGAVDAGPAAANIPPENARESRTNIRSGRQTGGTALGPRLLDNQTPAILCLLSPEGRDCLPHALRLDKVRPIDASRAEEGPPFEQQGKRTANSKIVIDRSGELKLPCVSNCCWNIRDEHWFVYTMRGCLTDLLRHLLDECFGLLAEADRSRRTALRVFLNRITCQIMRNER
jgi:hypothetical protein